MKSFDILIYFIDAIMFSVFYYCVFIGNFKKKIIVSTVLGILFLTCAIYIDSYHISDLVLSYFRSVTAFLMLLGFGEKYSILNKVILSILPNLLMSLISVFVAMVSTLIVFGKADYLMIVSAHEISISIAIRIILGIVFMCAIVDLNNIKKMQLSKIQKRLVAGMIALCYISVTLLENYLFHKKFTSMDLTIVIICTMITAWMIILLVKQMFISNMTQEHLEMEKELLNNEVITAKSLVESQKELHQMKHDLNHVLNTIKGYDKEALSSIYSKYSDKLDDVYVPIESNYEAINIILNTKYIQAKNNGISMKSVVNLPKPYPFKDDDLQLVLINLLDNAIENIGGEKYISVEILEIANMFIIKIENTVDGVVLDEYGHFTNFVRRPGHGYGIPSIYAVLKNYQGVMRYKQEFDLVKVTMTVPMEPY